MIFELTTFQNETGRAIIRRRPVDNRPPPAAPGDEFLFAGDMVITIESSDGRKGSQTIPLTFPIPAFTIEEAFEALPKMYDLHAATRLKALQDAEQKNREKQLRDILTN